MRPSYIDAHQRGDLRRRAARAREMLRSCTLCPRACRVDRAAGERGFCGVGAAADVASAGPHFGEEAPLVGRGGSGAIFLCSCNLRCVFCQNYDISHEHRGRETTAAGLAAIMLELQDMGCHNINLVTPTHQVPAILGALVDAVESGLVIPLVYNSSGYDSVETLRLLDGVFDIYMPDLKTLDPQWARAALRAEDYPAVVRAALVEMHRQVGDLVLDRRGIALRGLLVRHLVMPAGLATTRAGMELIRDELSTETYVNIMSQYHPAGEARLHPPIDRPVTAEECREAVRIAEDVGIRRLDQRRRRAEPRLVSIRRPRPDPR